MHHGRFTTIHVYRKYHLKPHMPKLNVQSDIKNKLVLPQDTVQDKV